MAETAKGYVRWLCPAYQDSDEIAPTQREAGLGDRPVAVLEALGLVRAEDGVYRPTE